MGVILKTKLSIAVATALALPLVGHAETEQLTTIVVEGSGSRPGAFALAPDSSGFKDMAALLERVPGANINRNGPLTGIPQYRGMYGNRVNVSIDGANMKEVGPNSMDPSLSHVPAALTRSLTVYRGLAPVSSGIDTIGGSMKVETMKGNFAEDEFESDGVISSGYSSVDNGYFVSGFTSLANQNHKVHLGVSKEEGNDYQYNDSDSLKVSPTEYDRQALTVGYEYQRNGHEFGFNFTDNNTINTGTPALPMDIVYVDGGLYNMNYNWDLGQGYQLKTKFFYQNMKHLMDNNTLRDPLNPNMLMENTTKVQGGGWDIALSMPLLSGDFTTGFTGDTSHHDSLIHMTMMPGTMMESNVYTNYFNDAERSRYSFFGEWKGEVADKLTAELGMRLTYTNADAGDVSSQNPMMQMAATKFNNQEHNKDFVDVDLVAVFDYALRTDLDLEVGFARKTRAPTYQELYLWAPSEATSGTADGRTYVGNLDLETEAAYQFEFGADWHTDEAYFAPRAFVHYVDDYIQGTPSDSIEAKQLRCPTTDACPVLQFNNIQALLYGVDFEAGYVFTDWVRLDAGLNYVGGNRLDGPKGNLYRIAPLNGRTTLTFSHSDFSFSAEGIYYAAQKNVADYNNEAQTPSYQIMNLRASYAAFDGFLIGLGIENVIDSDNQNHLGGYYRPMTDTTNEVSQGERISMPGRNYYATVSYQW